MTVTPLVKRVTAEKKSRLHIVCDVPDELIDFTFEWKGLKKLCVAVSFSVHSSRTKERARNDGQILYQFC